MGQRIDEWITWAIGNYNWKYGLQGEYVGVREIVYAAMHGYEQKGRAQAVPCTWDLIEERCWQWRQGRQDDAIA